MKKAALALSVALLLGVALVVTTSGDGAPGHAAPAARSASLPAARASRAVAPPASTPAATPRGTPAPPLRATASATPAVAARTPSAERTLEQTVREDVAKIAEPLALDRETASQIETLTLAMFRDFLEELRRAPRSSEDAERLLAERQQDLHARILALLTPARQARYREVVGLASEPAPR